MLQLPHHVGLDLIHRGKITPFKGRLQSGKEPDVTWHKVWAVRLAPNPLMETGEDEKKWA